MGAFLTAREAAAYCGQSYRGFDQFVRRYRVPHDWWGGTRRFRTETLDRVRQTHTQRKATARQRRTA